MKKEVVIPVICFVFSALMSFLIQQAMMISFLLGVCLSLVAVFKNKKIGNSQNTTLLFRAGIALSVAPFLVLSVIAFFMGGGLGDF